MTRQASEHVGFWCLPGTALRAFDKREYRRALEALRSFPPVDARAFVNPFRYHKGVL